MSDALYLEFKAAEAAERAALDAWSEANFAVPRDAADCRRLSDIHDLAYGRYRCALSALANALIPSPVADCAHCGMVHRTADLKALDTDYTADKAAYSWGLERDALLCESCRDELEEAYGRYADDGTDAAFENATDR